MLKIRMQGTKADIHWFRQLMERHREIDVKSASGTFTNKGTDRYFRAYAEVDRAGR